MSKPRGYIEKVAFLDVETSGLSYDNPVDASYDERTGKYYQIVSIGIVVASAQTLKPIETLYLEVKWNGSSLWDKQAERVHGLSLAYLEEHGVDEEEMVAQVCELLVKYWGPESPVCLGGHNVATFDRIFLIRALERHGITMRFGSKTIDTNSIGFAAFETHNSDDLFDIVGLPARDPEKHNALTDAMHALAAVRAVRSVVKQCTGGN